MILTADMLATCKASGSFAYLAVLLLNYIIIFSVYNLGGERKATVPRRRERVNKSLGIPNSYFIYSSRYGLEWGHSI